MSWTMPGTGIEINELIVIKEKSSWLFQINCTKTDRAKFRTIESLTCNCPSLKVLARLYIPGEINGGRALILEIPFESLVS